MSATQSPGHIRFLSFDSRPVELDLAVVDHAAHEQELRGIEAAMSMMVSPPHGGLGCLRVAVVAEVPASRSIFSGGEPAGDALLADALRETAKRPFGPYDIVFLTDGASLGGRGWADLSATHAAIHNVASLVAATAPPRARDTLYLSACAVLLLSLPMDPDRHAALTEMCLRLWVRAKQGLFGDPPEWDDVATEAVRRSDPWAARFMEGMGDALGGFVPLDLPASLFEVAEAARAVQASATLASAEAVGTA